MRYRLHHRGDRDNERGFTLVELLVVVVIIGILLALAIPALTKADYEGKLKSWSRRLAQDIQRARYEAVAQREDRLIKFTSTGTYELLGEVPGSGTQTLVKRVTLPQEVRIQTVNNCLALDNLPTTAGGGVAGAGCSMLGTFNVSYLKFSSIRSLKTDIGDGGGEQDKSVTIWLKSDDSAHYSRVLVYRTTGNVRYLEGQ